MTTNTLGNWREAREKKREPTLEDYVDLEPPKVVPGGSIDVPRDKGTAGRMGYDTNREQDVYVSPRSPGLHFFYKQNGWGVSERIMEKIRERGAKRIYIQERGGSKRGYDVVYEFTIDQYVNGEPIWDNGPDPQRVVDYTDAVYLWEGHSKSLWAGTDESEL